MPGALAAALALVLSLSQGGCGTVAGNPKKPNTDDTKNPPGSGLFEADLPVIDFDIGDSTFALSDSLSLADEDFGGKAFFNAYGRRINGIVRELNATSRRMNAITKQHGEKSDGAGDREGARESIRFKGKGRSASLSARISAVEGKSGYDREAVLCAGGKPFQTLRWSTSTKSLELWRDFRIAQGEGEAKFGVVTRVRATPGQTGKLALDVATLGTWSDPDEEDGRGGGLAERLFVDKGADGVATLRAVTDRFAGAVPRTFDADAWLVGKMFPSTSARRGYDPAFVAYSASSQRHGCRAGFDENAADLWSPDFQGPRFCLGRDKGNAPLFTQEAFRKHVAGFENVGLAKEADLEAIALPPGLSCE